MHGLLEFNQNVVSSCEKVLDYLKQQNYPVDGELEDGKIKIEVTDVVEEMDHLEYVLDIVTSMLTISHRAVVCWSESDIGEHYYIEIDLHSSQLLYNMLNSCDTSK